MSVILFSTSKPDKPNPQGTRRVMSRKISPAVGSVKCLIVSCPSYTKREDGICASCNSNNSKKAACAFCLGFAYKEGQRSYCDRHAGLFKTVISDDPNALNERKVLRFKNDVTAHLAAQVMNDFYRNGFQQIRYVGAGDVMNSRLLESQFINIDPQADKAILDKYRIIHTNLLRAIEAIDSDLTALYIELKERRNYAEDLFSDAMPLVHIERSSESSKEVLAKAQEILDDTAAKIRDNILASLAEKRKKDAIEPSPQAKPAGRPQGKNALDPADDWNDEPSLEVKPYVRTANEIAMGVSPDPFTGQSSR